MSDRVIVALDGSTHVSTAALVAGRPGSWSVLARRTDTDSRGQARVLLRLIDDMLAQTGRATADIGAIVTGIGPGTFTGVRIAVATARALALALGAPVFGVSTLAALAAGAATQVRPETIVPVVDARRGQVFYGIYRLGPSGAYERTDDFGVCDRASLFEHIPAGLEVLVTGDTGVVEGQGASGGFAGVELQPADVCAEYLVLGQDRLAEAAGGALGGRLDALLEQALAAGGAADKGSAQAGEAGTPESVKPIYVRSPDADIHITKMRDPGADAAREA